MAKCTCLSCNTGDESEKSNDRFILHVDFWNSFENIENELFIWEMSRDCFLSAKKLGRPHP